MQNYTTLITKKDICRNNKITINIGYRLVISLVLYVCSCFAASLASSFDELEPWSVMLYRGYTAKQTFGDALIGKYCGFGESIYTAELAYSLAKTNLFRKLFSYVFDEVQIAGNLTYRHDYTNHDNVKEGNLYIIWRFSKFPWQNYLFTTLAVGDGVSYASHPPFADREPNKPANEFSRLLNYLITELTFSLPSYPKWQLALRLHHRCTAWGTFSGNANAGSTAIGLGFRYYF